MPYLNMTQNNRLTPWFRYVLGTIVAIWIVTGAAPRALAAQLEFPSGDSVYTVLNADLRDALHQFCDDVHVRVSLSDAVKGRVRGRVSAASPRAFLDLITSMYSLDWYYDGYILYVTENGEGVTKLIDVSGIDTNLLVKALAVADVTDKRFPLRILPNASQITVSGPPRYVDLVAQTASALPARKPASDAPRDAVPPDDTMIIDRGTATQKVTFPR